MSLAVACVLKLGGDYDRNYVRRLRAGAARSLPPHRFVCLTDDPVLLYDEDWAEPLVNGWAGWWSKMELFRPRLYAHDEAVLYFDLDTVFVGRAELGTVDSFAMLPGFNRETNRRDEWASGVMAWHGEPPVPLYQRFLASPTLNGWDQVWIAQRWRELFGIEPQDVNAVVPGIVSYKKHCTLEGPPEGARVVCFHGKPRPHQATYVPWVREAWHG